MRCSPLIVGMPFVLGAVFAGILLSQGREGPAVAAAVKPSFTILPLLQEVEGRPGQRIKFSFEMATQDGEARLNVRIVGLKQDESGLIQPDEETPPPGDVQLFGPTEIQLRSGEKRRLDGEIILPLNAAGSMSYGLLVTDMGQALPNGERQGVNRVQVQFVTRYLLRVHVNVPGYRSSPGSQLDIQSADLVEENGQCLARVRLHNPHPGTRDVSVRCRLLPEQGPALDPPFYLVLPIRRRVDNGAKPECKVLGASTVNFEAVVPHPVASGDHRLEIDTMISRLPHLRRTYPIQIDEQQFPNHAQSVLQIAGVLRVEPAQVELSLKPRGDRFARLTVSNASRRNLDLDLAAVDEQGNRLSWVMVRPERFQLTPGAKRIVMIGVQQATGIQSNLYGDLTVTALAADGTVAARQPLRVGVLVADDQPPKYVLSPITLSQVSQRSVLVAALQNEGSVHLEPAGKLRLKGSDGFLAESTAVPGSWLLPGETAHLQFPLRSPPPPGEYRLTGEISLGHGFPPHVVDQRLLVTEPTLPVSTPVTDVP